MNAVRTEIREAAQNNVQPYYSESGNLMLRTAGGRRKLMQGTNLTPLGQLFFDTNGQQPPRGYSFGATPYRIGRTELISTPTGDRMTRRWNPVSSNWAYSQLGREYYNVSRQEVTIHIPVRVVGVRQNGSRYELANAYMPLTDDGIDQIYRPNGDMNALKQQVLSQFEGNERIDGELLVHEASQEQWFLRDAPWRVSTMDTNPAEGNPNVEVILQRPLGMLKTRLDHDLVIPEALQKRDDYTCCPRQMAVVLDTPYDKICEEFDSIQPYWRDKGVTSESILKYANKHGITTTVLYQDKLLAKYNPPDRKHAKAMTYQIEGKHALFFKNPRCMIFREPVKKAQERSEGLRSRI